MSTFSIQTINIETHYSVPYFRFCYESLILSLNHGHYAPKSPYSSPNVLLFTSKSLYGYLPARVIPYVRRGGWGCCMREARFAILGGGGDLNGRLFAGVCKTILAQEMYFPKPNTKPYSHSGYWVQRGLGTWSPWIIRDYNLAIAISIRQLTQPSTCEIGFSIFAAISWLKVASFLTHHLINWED